MGTYFRDKNAAYFPEHPMEPAIVAVCKQARNTDLAHVDVVACASTFGNLLRFVRHADLDQRDRKQFRMIVERVEDQDQKGADNRSTVFFVRRENSSRELIPNVRGFGHTFPEAYTTWDADARASVSHQRVLRYHFGGLAWLVRLEADGYIPGDDDDAGRVGGRQRPDATLDSLLAETSVTGETALSKATASGASLQIRQGGRVQPQDSIFDLKTRSVRKRDDGILLGQELPRLWVGQIPNLILAYHKDGLFEDIQVLRVRDKIQLWESAQAEALKKLIALVRLILVEIDKTPSGKLEVCHTEMGRLDIRQPGPGVTDALSAEARKMWADCRRTDCGSDGNHDRGDEDYNSDENSSVDDGIELSWNDAADDYTACSNACGYCGRCSY